MDLKVMNVFSAEAQTLSRQALPELVHWIFFPYLGAFALIILFLRRRETLAMAVGTGASMISLAATIAVYHYHHAFFNAFDAPITWTIRWLATSSAKFEFGYLIDPLSVLMLIVVQSVSCIVCIYSMGYMRGDPDRPRFFAYLALFSASMTGLVVAPNLLQTYIFWELVGLCSYLLIGFWWRKPEAAAAAKKAFVMTRFGDLGFLIGVLMLIHHAGTTSFLELNPMLLPATVATAAGLLIFAGIAGKSAQFPLHVWLPDAMEGPTPVSALIHAATMVVAGVYLLTRAAALFMASELVMNLILVIGTITALVAATIACVQNDIKKVFAYSTISQLGYMVLAFGADGPEQSMFHLFTHAFYKAALFLTAGSLIHLAHSNDIFEIGRKGGRDMKITFWTMVIAGAALAGIPPLSGFFSKDAILARLQTLDSPLFYITALFTGFLTAYYTFRVIFIIARRPEQHGHESPFSMTLPLAVLAVLTCWAGSWHDEFEFYLTGGMTAPMHMDVAVTSTLCALLGVAFAAKSFAWNSAREGAIDRLPVMVLPRNKYYLDDLYEWITRVVVRGTAAVCAWIDRHYVDGAVNAVSDTVGWTGEKWSWMQTGKIYVYLNFSVSIICILGIIIWAF